MLTTIQSVGRYGVRTALHLIGVAGLVLSCSSQNADKASGSPQPGVDTPAAAEEPSMPPSVEPSNGSNVAPEITGLPSSEVDPTTVTESTPPTPESTEAALSLEDRVKPLVAAVSEAKLVFIACDETPCTLRAQASTLSPLHQLLTSLSQEFAGQIGFTVREQLDGYTGRSFQTDVMLDVSEGARQVPADEADLLASP